MLLFSRSLALRSPLLESKDGLVRGTLYEKSAAISSRQKS